MKRFKEIIKETRVKQVESSHDPREYDFEGEMTKRDLETIAMHIQRIESLIDDETNMPEWVQGKITLAKDYIQTVSDYLASDLHKEGVNEGLSHSDLIALIPAASAVWGAGMGIPFGKSERSVSDRIIDASEKAGEKLSASKEKIKKKLLPKNSVKEEFSEETEEDDIKHRFKEDFRGEKRSVINAIRSLNKKSRNIDYSDKEREGFRKDKEAEKERLKTHYQSEQLVTDKKTGKEYDPEKEFNNLMNDPKHVAQFKRMKAEQGKGWSKRQK